MRLILENPQKKFGEIRISDICPAILSSDYKSPKFVIEWNV